MKKTEDPRMYLRWEGMGYCLFDFPPRRRLITVRKGNSSRYKSSSTPEHREFHIALPWNPTLATRQGIWVFARPGPLTSINDPLFHLPVSNIHLDGTPCWGYGYPNVEAKAEFDQIYAKVESFWNTNFNGGWYTRAEHIPDELLPRSSGHGPGRGNESDKNYNATNYEYFGRMEKSSVRKAMTWTLKPVAGATLRKLIPVSVKDEVLNSQLAA